MVSSGGGRHLLSIITGMDFAPQASRESALVQGEPSQFFAGGGLARPLILHELAHGK